MIADLTAGRTQRWLDELTAAGHLPEHYRVAVAADDARTSLDQLLRTVELAGHDPAQALADAVTREHPGRVDVGGAGAALPRPRGLPRPADPADRQLRAISCPQHLPEQAHTALRDARRRR